jgi:hypothetical protein
VTILHHGHPVLAKSAGFNLLEWNHLLMKFAPSLRSGAESRNETDFLKVNLLLGSQKPETFGHLGASRMVKKFKSTEEFDWDSRPFLRDTDLSCWLSFRLRLYSNRSNFIFAWKN